MSCHLSDDVDGHPRAALLDALQHSLPGDVGEPLGSGFRCANKVHGGCVTVVALQTWKLRLQIAFARFRKLNLLLLRAIYHTPDPCPVVDFLLSHPIITVLCIQHDSLEAPRWDQQIMERLKVDTLAAPMFQMPITAPSSPRAHSFQHCNQNRQWQKDLAADAQ